MSDKTISDRGIKLIAKWEGSGPMENGKHRPYKDVAGFLTVGYGHLLTKSELSSGKLFLPSGPIRWNDGLDRNQSLALLKEDASQSDKAVRDGVKVSLEQYEHDALVAFVFNVGIRAFQNSSLLKILNAGNKKEVPSQLMRWVYAGGQKVGGLVNRRRKEASLWNNTMTEVV